MISQSKAKDDSGADSLDAGDPVIFQLAPLDQDRVARFADHCGVQITDVFVEAIDQHNAWAFTRRPIDVSGLVDFWREKRRLGSLRELIEYELNRHLNERPDRQGNLTPEQARTGAEWLAAASVFCRETNIRVPDEHRDALSDALEPADVLPPDWKPEWVRALLQRGIFDAASYGRIRFHHRRITEYLAAQWLSGIIRDGRDLPSLLDLLFTEVDGARILRPSLAPVAAWLLLGQERWNLELRDLVLQTAPGLLLQHGDPKELPLAYKQNALRRLVERYRDRRRVWIRIDTETLSRIAEPGLAGTVTEILRDTSVSEDLRCEMLRLVRHGGIEGCIDTALDVVADPAASATIKSDAAAAVRDVGTNQHKRRLADIAAGMVSIPSRLCARICEAIFPKTAGGFEVITLLSKVENVPQFSLDLPYHLREHLKSLKGHYDPVPLLAGLTELGQSEPWITFHEEPRGFSERFYWVGEPMVQALSDLFATSELDAHAVSVAATTLKLLKLIRRHPEVHLDVSNELGERLAHHDQLRRRYIWNGIEELRAREGTDRIWLHQLFEYDCPLSPDPRDLEWLIRDIAEAEESADRQAALHLALQYWSMRGRRWRVLYRIWWAIADQPVLRWTLLSSREARPWQPLVRFWYRNIRNKLLSRWWYKQQRRAVSGFLKRLQEKGWLLRHLPGLYSGNLCRTLKVLAQEAHSENGEHDHLAATDWEALAKKRGWLVAYAAKRGCKSRWKRFTPPLICEGASDSNIDCRIVVGLSGLEALWVDGELDFRSLAEGEAETAARYAFREMDNFPPWFPKLVDVWPSVVRSLLLTAIDHEWRVPKEQEHVYEEMHRLVHHGEYVLPLVEADLLRRIQKSEPTNLHVLVQALEILTKRPLVSRKQLGTITLQQMPIRESDRPRQLIWLSLGLQTDAGHTLDYLEKVLPTEENPGDLIVGLCAALDNRHSWYLKSPLIVRPDYQHPQHLRRLILTVYRYVRPEDDLDRSGGGMHSPTARDGAQHFRDGLLPRLASENDPAGLGVLRQLLEEPLLYQEREWIRHLIDEHIEVVAERPPWTPKTLHEFAADFEYAPRTPYELYMLALSRFADIKHSVEAATVSARDDLRKGDNEAKLRSWLRRQLVDRCRDRYSVPQEEEIDLEKRPDLHIEVPGMPPLPVEIKWADRWTINQLLERLENQLIGDYLHAYENRYGIFLIGYHAEKDYWKTPGTGKQLTLNGLFDLLQKRADVLVSERDGVDSIRVISIDFTRPD